LPDAAQQQTLPVAAACADASTGPTMNAETVCDTSNPNTCK